MSDGPAVGAREAAAALLVEWEAGPPHRRPPLQSLIHEWLPRVSAPQQEAERALFTELVNGVVRWRRLLDHILDQRLARPRRLPPWVRAILRVAAYQLLFLGRIPPRAAVSEAVRLTARGPHRWAKGVVNGVGRRLARDVDAQGRDGFLRGVTERLTGPEGLGIACSFPTWMVELMAEQLGEEQAREVMEFSNGRPPLALRVNSARISRDDYLALLRERGIDALPGRISPCAVLIPRSLPPRSLPGLREGLFYVQDEAAQLASLLLAPAPGSKVLDLCAGVGGKALHLAQLAPCRVIATDTDVRRLSTLRENARRMGVTNVETVARDEVSYLAPFDAVMVDAPCSGLGVVRRHPDIKWNRSPRDLEALAEKQVDLVEEAVGLLAPGGRLLYSVCTFTREETVAVVEEVLRRHPASLRPVDLAPIAPEGARGWIAGAGWLRIRPAGPLGPDLFSICIMERAA